MRLTHMGTDDVKAEVNNVLDNPGYGTFIPSVENITNELSKNEDQLRELLLSGETDEDHKKGENEENRIRRLDMAWSMALGTSTVIKCLRLILKMAIERERGTRDAELDFKLMKDSLERAGLRVKKERG